MVTPEEIKQFMTELGFSVPDTVLQMLAKKVGEKYGCLLDYGENTANLLALYAIARLASLSGARKLSSQSAPNGASRSFVYDSAGTDYLLQQIRAWDTNGCLDDLPLESKKTGFFMVVGGACEFDR